MDLKSAIEYIIDGEGLLFLGAGFSSNAQNILHETMKMAPQLSNELCEELNIPKNDNLSDVADFYLDSDVVEDGGKKLIRKLQNNYKCKYVSGEHEEVADLDWLRVYTTNYDNVFELASDRVGKRRVPHIISDNMKSVEKTTSILHVNGYINLLTIDQLNDQFKLTTTSYMREDFSNTDWCGLFRNDLLRARVIVLIGVSMDYDEQLQKMLAENSNYKNKIIFIDKKEDVELEESIKNNPMYKYKKRKYGKIYEIGIEGFAEEIKSIRSTYKPKSRKVDFRSFTHINKKQFELDTISGNDYWALLVYGDVSESLIFNNINNNEYIIDRKQLENFSEEILSDDIKVAIIHSDLGNGKTCSVMKLGYKLKEFGEVFWLNDDKGDIAREIEEISKLSGKKFIIIENYGNYFDVLSKMKIYLDNDIKLILTERTSINTSIYYTLKGKLDIDDKFIKDYNLNNIEISDLDNLTNILNQVDKWEDRELDDKQKKQKIIDEYKNNFREILIKLVRSKKISEKINKVFNSIKDNRLKKNILLAICVNSIINTGLELNDIVALLQIKINNNVTKDKNMNELVNFNSNIIKAKSSILAQYIIHSNRLEQETLAIMKKMVIRANELKYGNKIDAVIKDFVSASNMLLVLNKKDENINEQVLEYYDELKDSYKRNPFFYLQYAMACLDMNYYERAGEYIDIAYKEAELINEKYKYKQGKRFDTFQIDTQNGRYILQKAITEKNEKAPYKTFSKVHDLFIATLNKEKTQEQLVYRQVDKYVDYFKVYKNSFSYEERKKYIECVNEMIGRIDNYKTKNKDKEIDKIGRSLNSLVGQIIKSMCC